jgi:carotenoid cleavage dioxygenase-like enzyme
VTGPAYPSGYLAPVPDEIDAFDLPVTGSLPHDLTGRYFRNGPNPLPDQDPGHWFTGAGMIHGVRLRGGRILALVESGLPYEMTAELDTVGPCDFGGRLTTAMTAHPKQDPETGELHFFGYGAMPPYLTYHHRLDAAGELVASREVAVAGPTMMHDFTITAHHVVWLNLLYTVSEHAIVKYDTGTGGVTVHDLGADRHPGEAVFVPADGARAEDGGWLISIVTDPAGSNLLVLDAADLAPVASVGLPRRVPAGFHGSWIADRA